MLIPGDHANFLTFSDTHPTSTNTHKMISINHNIKTVPRTTNEMSQNEELTGILTSYFSED